jgi:ribose transport system substrate-binding protein
MKGKIGIVSMVAIALLVCILGCAPKTAAPGASSDDGAFNGSADQVYYMNVFLPGAEFWKGCWDGFQAAADQLGVTIKFTGPTNYDAAEQVETFEQILAQNPAGILVCPLDEDSLRVPVQKALDMGIPVSTFFIDVRGTNRLSNLGPSPEAEGAAVAYNLAKMIGGAGDIGIITRPQDNVARRIVEFERIIATEFPNIKIVQSVYAESDTTVATERASAMLQANRNLKAIIPFAALEAIGVAQAKKETGLNFKIITVETDPGVLDLIKDGLIDGTVGQDTYSPAYFALINLFIAKNKLCQPYTDWQKNPWSPLPEQVAFPTAFITKENADLFEPPTW